MSRRRFLQVTSATALGGLLAACSRTGETSSATTAATTTTQAATTTTQAPVALDLPFEVAPNAINPLGVPDVNAEGVFFEGGFGIDYLHNVADLFQRLHPEASVSVEGIQGVGEVLRPRFIAGNPPDVIDNSGAGNLDTTALATEGSLLDLAPLMAAPALDTPGKTFAETLLPGSQAAGVFDGKQLALNIAYTVFGVWYSRSLFEEKGWTYPSNWDEMLNLCETIRSSGIAPWTYQGAHPVYLNFGLLNGMVYDIAGDEAWRAVDNLEPGAWEHDAIVTAVGQLEQLATEGYILEGTPALNHTDSQAAWLRGEAAFIPCGTWLENEMRDVTPDGFDMVLTAPYGHGAAIVAQAGETFFVPADAENPEAGMEYLRILMSKESAKFFAQNVGSLMPVAGATEGIEVSSAVTSALEAATAAGNNVFPRPAYGRWYSDLSTESNNAIGEVLAGRISANEYIERVQAKADEVAADSTIEKFSR